MTEPVLSIDDGGVCVITLNRPARLNAINPALLGGLNTALARADADDRIGAIVLTGAGRAFCAGDDLVEQRSMLDADEATITGFVGAIQQVTRHLMFGDTPVVAAMRDPDTYARIERESERGRSQSSERAQDGHRPC